jgi:DNA-binding NarL/FixJ family response regulator
MRLLLAEPDPALSRSILAACGDMVHATACRDFACARAHLVADAPRVLVTNLRLADYNGLHLIMLAKADRRATRCIVYTDRPDRYLIREAQAHGAFFESTDRLPHAIAAYVRAVLPRRDRRDIERYDRRVIFRGGRRAADQRVFT